MYIRGRHEWEETMHHEKKVESQFFPHWFDLGEVGPKTRNRVKVERGWKKYSCDIPTSKFRWYIIVPCIFMHYLWWTKSQNKDMRCLSCDGYLCWGKREKNVAKQFMSFSIFCCGNSNPKFSKSISLYKMLCEPPTFIAPLPFLRII